jgi:16S rRNA (adenine1518-N6/adenine1519-N6)-dimethyltransferase
MRSNMHHQPKKSLGQHFLIDKNMIAKIIHSFELLDGDMVLEIGPGEGALTNVLLDMNCQLTSLELDTALAKKWQEIAKERVDFTCYEADATKIDWSSFLPIDKLVGNIPYNVSRPLMYKAFEHRDGIDKLIFMVQKEFAEKLIAQPGDEAYGILAVLSQSFADVKLLFTIPPSVFYPPPMVISACVKLDFIDIDIDDDMFIHIVQTAFNQRRKTLRNSLKEYYFPELEHLLDWGKRADQLLPEEFLEIAKIIQNKP